MDPVRKRLAGFPVFIQLASAVAVVILLASASYFIIERPFLNLKDRFRETPIAATSWPEPA